MHIRLPNNIRGIECGLTWPVSDDNIEIYLCNLPKFLNILLIISFFTIIALSFFLYNNSFVLAKSFFIASIISFPLVCFHECSHYCVLRFWNHDIPAIHFGLKSYCVPQKPVQLPVFVIDLIAPLWIIVILGIVLFFQIIFDISKPYCLITAYAFIIQLYGTATDLYWLYLLRNTPKDRYVICNGLSAVVYSKKSPSY